MAYNPFNVFRRNQKAIFAVVTVVIMFMFVLSSGMTGKADFFNWLPEWFASKKKGEVLCTIDGDKVSQPRLGTDPLSPGARQQIPRLCRPVRGLDQ